MDATKLAKELIELHDHPRQVAPFSSRFPGLTEETGYATACLLHTHRLAQGWKLAGRKNGFTNRGIWERYGVKGPMWGAVYDRTLIFAKGNKAVVSLEGLVQPRIEPEICFRLKARPPASSDARDPQALLGCIEWIAHSIEIVQCHHPEWKVTIADGTTDNGLHGCLVLGTPVAVEEISGLAAALPQVKVDLMKGREMKDQGLGSNVLDSPLLALSFLIELLNKQPDSPPLQPGEVISTGTLTDAHPVQAGETWRTAFTGIALPGLEITFA